MKNCLSNNSAKRGFTMVEILVVIGIIALLAAIVFPVLGRVRESGRSTTCLNNLRQLGLAFQQYQTDYKRFPLPGQYQKWANGGHWIMGGDATGPKDFTDSEKGLAEAVDPFNYVTGHQAWVEKGAIYPYVKEVNAYVCPSAREYKDKKLSYSMNCALAGLGEQRIREPGKIVLLVDEGDTVNDGYFWATSNAASTDGLTKKHNGGGNLLFADGHVKFYPFNALSLDSTAGGLAIKSSTKNDVRFLDLGFGPKGASVIPALQDNPAIPPKTDSCATGL